MRRTLRTSGVRKACDRPRGRRVAGQDSPAPTSPDGEGPAPSRSFGVAGPWCNHWTQTEQHCILGQRRRASSSLCRAPLSPLFCDDELKPPAAFPVCRQPTSPWGSPRRGTRPAVRGDGLKVLRCGAVTTGRRAVPPQTFYVGIKVFSSTSVSSRFSALPVGVWDSEVQEARANRAQRGPVAGARRAGARGLRR